MSTAHAYTDLLRSDTTAGLRCRLASARLSAARPLEQTAERQDGWKMVVAEIEAEIARREQAEARAA